MAINRNILNMINGISSNMPADDFGRTYQSVLTYILGTIRTDWFTAQGTMRLLHDASYSAWAHGGGTPFARQIAQHNRELFAGPLDTLRAQLDAGLDILGSIYNLEAATGNDLRNAARNVTTAVTDLYGADHVQVRVPSALVSVQRIGDKEVLVIGAH
jgi:hypothetical protein